MSDVLHIPQSSRCGCFSPVSFVSEYLLSIEVSYLRAYCPLSHLIHWYLILFVVHFSMSSFNIEALLLVISTLHCVTKWHPSGVNTIRCRYNAVRYNMIYCKRHFNDRSRISIKFWTHKRHPIPRPNGPAMGCLCEDFESKNWPRYNSTALN